MIESLGFEGKRIFETELSEDRRSLIITEVCDMYFDAVLSRSQVIELAKDFLNIAEKMVF